MEVPRVEPHKSRGSAVSYPRRVLVALAAVSFSGCFLPPDPAQPDPAGSSAIRGSGEGPEGAAAPRRDSLLDGAWRVADPIERTVGATSLTPRVASTLSLGTWAAEVQPPGSEQLPDVSLWLRDLVLPGDAAGTAEYRFDGYRCRYALFVEAVAENTIRLRQRLETGRCAGPGRIVLVWEDGESLVGDWVRPDGSAWFRARLSRIEDVSALPVGPGGRSEMAPGPG